MPSQPVWLYHGEKRQRNKEEEKTAFQFILMVQASFSWYRKVCKYPHRNTHSGPHWHCAYFCVDTYKLSPWTSPVTTIPKSLALSHPVREAFTKGE